MMQINVAQKLKGSNNDMMMECIAVPAHACRWVVAQSLCFVYLADQGCKKGAGGEAGKLEATTAPGTNGWGHGHKPSKSGCLPLSS